MNLADLLANQDEENAKTKRVYGVATGLVTDNKDPEGFGRVKVEFPWLAEDSETDWVKVATFMGGKKRGAFFLPEVGDEVLVAFEHGDLDYPYVIGALWSNEDQPPESNDDGKNNIRKITSRSGHEIVFCDDDEGQKEKIEVHTKSGHRIVLDDAAGGEKITIRDKTDSNFIEIDSVQNTISLESTKSVKLSAPTVEIDAGTTVQVKSGAKMSVEAGATLDIKGALVNIN